MTEEFRRWANIAADMFGPGLALDVCTIDAIADAKGRKFILEVNGTSSGLFPDCAAEVIRPSYSFSIYIFDA